MRSYNNLANKRILTIQQDNGQMILQSNPQLHLVFCK